MVSLELTPEEEKTLWHLLRRWEDNLEVEIRHTDHREFREILKHQRELVTGIIQRLSQATSVLAEA